MIKDYGHYGIFASMKSPNPDEIGYWADLSADAQGNIIKFYDPEINKWVKLTDASSEYAVAPWIGGNGNWFVENRDTGVSAIGKTPIIGPAPDYNWLLWDSATNTFTDSGVSSKGQKGDEGRQGPPGIPGQPGPMGLPGRDGIDGKDGKDGKDGVDGLPGIQGPEGKQGPIGPEGKQGIQGPEGPEGKKGDKGDTGEPGKDGKDGTGVNILGSYDTYEDLVAAHPTGNIGDAYLVQGDLYVWDDANSQWLNVGTIKGEKGDPGQKGEKGDTGLTGPAGKDGEQGPVGPEGQQGIEGPVGPVGPPGADGKDGQDGAPGEQGPIGPEGPPGRDGVDGVDGVDGQDGAKGDKGDSGVYYGVGPVPEDTMVWIDPSGTPDNILTMDSVLAGNNITLNKDLTNNKLYINSTGGGGTSEAVWGSITGTLADQTDLSLTLDSKVNEDDLDTALDGIYSSLDGIDEALSNKVDSIAGMGLSSNDYTSAEKAKLSRIGKYLGNVILAPNETSATFFLTYKDPNGSGDSTIGLSLTPPTNGKVGVLTYDRQVKLDSLTNYDDTAITGRVSSLEVDMAAAETDIDGLRQQILESEHFKGYFATTSEIEAIVATPGDFAYNAETGTKWVYDGEEWEDSLVAVPDQMVPKSTSTPLMDGNASVGILSSYAAGDHRHPTDTSRASQTDLSALSATVAGKVDAVTGKGLSTEDYTTADKTKLTGVESNANYYIHPSYSSATSGLYKISVDSNGHVTTPVAVVKADIIALGIPSQDTTYTNATTSKAGLMSAADKIKLNGLSNYDDTALTTRVTTAEGNISSLGTRVTTLEQGGGGSYSDVTPVNGAVSGLMTSTDKRKLDRHDMLTTIPIGTGINSGNYVIDFDMTNPGTSLNYMIEVNRYLSYFKITPSGDYVGKTMTILINNVYADGEISMDFSRSPNPTRFVYMWKEDATYNKMYLAGQYTTLTITFVSETTYLVNRIYSYFGDLPLATSDVQGCIALGANMSLGGSNSNKLRIRWAQGITAEEDDDFYDRYYGLMYDGDKKKLDQLESLQIQTNTLYAFGSTAYNGRTGRVQLCQMTSSKSINYEGGRAGTTSKMIIENVSASTITISVDTGSWVILGSQSGSFTIPAGGFYEVNVTALNDTGGYNYRMFVRYNPL